MAILKKAITAMPAGGVIAACELAPTGTGAARSVLPAAAVPVPRQQSGDQFLGIRRLLRGHQLPRRLALEPLSGRIVLAAHLLHHPGRHPVPAAGRAARLRDGGVMAGDHFEQVLTGYVQGWRDGYSQAMHDVEDLMGGGN
jgi:hypothetical protein